MAGLASFIRTSLLIQGAVEILLGLLIALNGMRSILFARPSRFGLAVTLITASLTVIFGALQCFSAWAWKMKKPYARRMVFFVSILNLTLLGFGSILGGIGIYLCSGKRAAAFLEHGASDTAREPRPGDGTKKWVQYAWPALSIAWWAFSTFTLTELGIVRGLPAAAPLQGILLIIVVTFTTVLIHELGHCIAGWASDFSLFKLHVGPLLAFRKDGRWRYEFSMSGLFGGGGAAGMAPRHLRNLRARMAFLTAGGPAGSLLCSVSSGLLSMVLLDSPYAIWWKVPALVSMWALGDFFLNLIPILGCTGYSDGAVLAQLIEGGPWADIRLAMAAATMTTSTTARPAELDSALLRKAVAGSDGYPEQPILNLISMMHYIDRDNLPKARILLESALQKPELLTDPGIMTEIAFYIAYLNRDARQARGWLDEARKKAEAKRYNLKNDLELWACSAMLHWMEGKASEAEMEWEVAWNLAMAKPAFGFYAYERWLLQEIKQEWVERKETSLSLAGLIQGVGTSAEVKIPANKVLANK